MRWDLFCAVIDNYGDVGVCWRLARQLAAEHGQAVRLWVDDLQRLARIAHQVDPLRPSQVVGGVEIRPWGPAWVPAEPADVVIEAFACHLPPAYEAAMAARARAPVWINLEYLSAEPWVAGSHGLPSRHPRLGLAKTFFFPGFEAGTGGLLAEEGLAARRAAWEADAQAQAALWRDLGVAPDPQALRVSLFSYDNPAAAGLFRAWSAGGRPVCCFVPQGSARGALGDAAGLGRVHRAGALDVWQVPFLDQARYDELLWACGLNLVRGEDSFVRAQYAGRPLVWQIYPQAEDAHWAKLEAWQRLYAAGLAPETAGAWTRFLHAWNRQDAAAVEAAWPALEPALIPLTAHARDWAGRLLAAPDLCTRLVAFCRGRLQ